jgi:hypothetical protein
VLRCRISGCGVGTTALTSSPPLNGHLRNTYQIWRPVAVSL